MVSTVAKSAIAFALGVLLLICLLPMAVAANPKDAPGFVKVYSENGDESLTAWCTPENTHPERGVPREVTCKFTHVRFQTPKPSDPKDHPFFVFTLPIEEAVKSNQELAAEFRNDPKKAKNDWEEAKRSALKMFCSGGLESQIAALDPASHRKRDFTLLMNACSKTDDFAELFRMISRKENDANKTCGMWVDNFDLDFRRIDQGKWATSGTGKIYELSPDKPTSWKLTETKMTMGQKGDAGSKPVAERRVWRMWNWDSYEIPDECRYISHLQVQAR